MSRVCRSCNCPILGWLHLTHTVSRCSYKVNQWHIRQGLGPSLKCALQNSQKISLHVNTALVLFIEPSQNQPSCQINELPPLEVWPSPSSQKIYHGNDETHSMPSAIWKGAGKKKNYAAIFGGNMRQLCGKQTELCKQISKLTKLITRPSELLNNNEMKNTSSL